VDTSTVATSVALVEGESASSPVVLAARSVAAANRHGELLAPLLREVLDEAGNGYDAVAVGIGPGPFTGLRAGIATAIAAAQVYGVPTYAACSLDLLAAAGVVVVQDARRREVYWAGYDERGVRTEGPSVGPPSLVPLRGRRVVGAGAAAWPDVFGPDVFDAARDLHLPAAQDLWGLVADKALSGAAADELTPLYLRRPDAKTLIERGLA
jgi:tRNA threonylcarbamoyl adenosine modification protein YeaZ